MYVAPLTIMLFLLAMFNVTRRFAVPLLSRQVIVALALSVSAVMYTVVLAGHQWVHVNPDNPTYVLLVCLIFVAALVWFVEPWLMRLPAPVVYVLAGAGLAMATFQTISHRPRETSTQFRAAQQLLARTNEFGGTVPLLGEYWVACVNSYFDPHRLVASCFEGGLIADTMLAEVCSYPRILVNFSQATQFLCWDGTMPEVMLVRNKILASESARALPADRQWHPYRVFGYDDAVVGSNVLLGVLPQIRGSAVYTNGVLAMQRTTNTYAEVLWTLGNVPRGLYLLELTARYRGTPPPDELMVLHFMDSRIQPPCRNLAVQPSEANWCFTEYHELAYYVGDGTPTSVRLYSLTGEAYDVVSVGVYPVTLPTGPSGQLPARRTQ